VLVFPIQGERKLALQFESLPPTGLSGIRGMKIEWITEMLLMEYCSCSKWIWQMFITALVKNQTRTVRASATGLDNARLCWGHCPYARAGGHCYECRDVHWIFPAGRHFWAPLLPCPRFFSHSLIMGWPCQLLGPCLVPKKFYKIFYILRHIESLDACIEY